MHYFVKQSIMHICLTHMHKILSMKQLKNVIAQNVDKACKARDESANSLAKKTQINQTTISRLINMRDDMPDPRLGTLIEVSKALNIEIWTLFFDNIDPNLMTNKQMTNLMNLLSECSEAEQKSILDQAVSLAELALYKKAKGSKLDS